MDQNEQNNIQQEFNQILVDALQKKMSLFIKKVVEALDSSQMIKIMIEQRELLDKFSSENKLFYDILMKAAEDLQWCSGSDDFAIDGKSRKGWEKGPQRLIEIIDKIKEYKEQKKGELNDISIDY